MSAGIKGILQQEEVAALKAAVFRRIVEASRLGEHV